MMLTLQDLSFQYPNGNALFERFNLNVNAGEAWTILGPSGCGKTTLLYLIAGLRKPASGQVRIHGSPLQRPRPQTGLILQDFGLLPWATVRQNASLGIRIRSFYGPDGLHAPPEEQAAPADADVDSWLERLRLMQVADHYPAQLSGGQRQRTAIARTLALNPDLLLMDEPFASLDAPTRESLQDLILELQRERELTVITVTHTIEEAAVLGDQILLLGQPPNYAGLSVDNPGGAQPGFRGTEAYRTVCSHLRTLLEAQG